MCFNRSNPFFADQPDIAFLRHPDSERQVYHTTQADGYSMTCNLITTSQLPARSAREFGIDRDDSRILLNVVVQKNGGTTVSADVEAQSIDQLGHVRPIEMRFSKANDYISYFGTFTPVPRECLEFEIKIRPHDRLERFTMTFEEQVLRD